MSLNNMKRKFRPNTLQDDKEGSAAKVKQLENTIVFLEEELESEKMRNDNMKQQIECPVCLEVPRKGPVYSCPNGHLVCQKCKRESCPTCREAMGETKSLVAVAVIESILHDCKYFECVEKFPLNEIEEHEKYCKHRSVACPYYLRCAQMVPLSKLLTHLKTSPSCCFTRQPLVFKGSSRTAGFTVTSAALSAEITFAVKTFCFHGNCFALNVHKSGDFWRFVIIMFVTPEVCKEFNIETEVYETDSPPDARLSAKFRCHPCSIDKTIAEIEGSGLVVHHKFMEQMILKEDRFEFTVSISFL